MIVARLVQRGAVEIEVGVIGQVDHRRRICRRPILDDQFIVVRDGIEYLDIQISGKT